MARVDEFEIEFCKECGMEFLNGIEEVCPLCGNKVDIEIDPTEELVPVVGAKLAYSEFCAICKNWCEPSDQWFWKYWNNFDSPKWLSDNRMWCIDCIIERFKRDHPDFESTGLEPDTYLIWKQALDSGINLGPKLYDIEMSNSIRRLDEYSVYRDDIIQWLASDCSIDEAEQWVSLSIEFDEAMAWRDAGFDSDEETTGIWIEWGCTPKKAAKYVKQGIDYAPNIGFKKLGVKLEDALFYEAYEFSPDRYEYKNFIRPWLPSGLPPAEIVSLRDQLVAKDEVFEALHESSQSRVNYKDRTHHYWDALPSNFESLKEVGLPISAANLEKYWGLSSKEILEVIDSGGNPGVVAEVLRHGGSVGNLLIIERLLDSEVDLSSATFLAQRGFLPKHLKHAEKLGVVLTILMELEEILEADDEIEIDEVLSWLEIGARVSQVKSWKMHGFAPQEAMKWSNQGFQPETASSWRAAGVGLQEAMKWSNEGFQPETANKWRAAGVDSPVTAKRRRDAGLQP